MKRGWFVLLALSLGLNAGLAYTVIAQRSARGFGGMPMRMGPGDHPMPGRPPAEDMGQMARQRLERVSRWLNLDESQRQGLGALLEESMPRIMAQRDSVREARRLAAAEYLKPVLDPEAIRLSVRRLNVAQARLDSLVSETMAHEATILTPEQRTRYFEAMPWGPHPEEGPGHGMRHGPRR